MYDRQRGMTIWSASFVIGVVVFALFVTFKLIPPYLEAARVKAALESLAHGPDAGSKPKVELADSLGKKLYIDSVTEVDPRRDFFVERKGRIIVLRVAYDRVIPLFYNISILIEFDFSREVPAVE